MAALARLGAARQRRQHRNRHPQPGAQVGHRQTGFDGAATALPGQAHDAGHGLEHRVIALSLGIGPRHAKAGAAYVNQLVVDGAQRGVVQAILAQIADRKVLQHHIGLCGQLAHHRLPLLGAQVHRH